MRTKIHNDPYLQNSESNAARRSDEAVDPLAVQAAIALRAMSTGGQGDFNQGQIFCRHPGTENFSIKGALVGFDEGTPLDSSWPV